MTTIIATITPTTTVETLAAEAAEGSVKFHRERGNGTTRRVQYLADGTAERETAEWITVQRSEGRTMKAIAAEMHVSVPTVRRMINALLLTWEVEEDAEDLLDTVEIAVVEEQPLTQGAYEAAHEEALRLNAARGSFEALVATGAAEGQQG